MTNSREKFEAWAAYELGDIRLGGDGDYLFDDVRAAYKAWLAGRESMRDEAAAQIKEIQP